MKKGLIILCMFFFVISCNNSDDNSSDNNIELSEIAVVELTETPKIDYYVASNASSEFFVVETLESQSAIPHKILYFNEDINDYINILLDEAGSIDKLIIEDNIFIFRNKNEYTFDLGVYTNSDEEILFSEIESEFNWSTNSLSRGINGSFLNSLIENSSYTLAGVQCVLAAIQTFLGNVSLGTLLSSFECGLGIGDAIADILVDNGFQIYVDQEVIDNFDQFFEYYDAFSLWFNCVDITDLAGFRDCFLSVLSNVLSNIDDAEALLNENGDEIDEIINSVNSLFHSEFIDFSNDEIPQDWEFYTTNNADISSERMNAYTLDGVAKLTKNGMVGRNVTEIKLEMDVYIAYSFWGLVYNFIISANNESMGFRTGQEDFEYPQNTIANLVQFYNENGANLVDESLSAVEEGIYHVELMINQSNYIFRCENDMGGEVFNLIVPLENYIGLIAIDKIEFSNIANTNNDGWIDNIRLTFN